MVNGSTLTTGLEAVKATAAGLTAAGLETKPKKPRKAVARKPKKTEAKAAKAAKKAAKSDGAGMNGPHRPKVLTAWVEEDVHKAFRRIAVDENTSMQRLVCEGINLLLASRKLKTRTAIE